LAAAAGAPVFAALLRVKFSSTGVASTAERAINEISLASYLLVLEKASHLPILIP
jgi:hypothetical protein